MENRGQILSRRNSEKLSEMFLDKVHPLKIYVTKFSVANVYYYRCVLISKISQICAEETCESFFQVFQPQKCQKRLKTYAIR